VLRSASESTTAKHKNALSKMEGSRSLSYPSVSCALQGTGAQGESPPNGVNADEPAPRTLFLAFSAHLGDRGPSPHSEEVTGTTTCAPPPPSRILPQRPPPGSSV